MVVRGWPAIGATAGYGMAQAAHQGLDLKAAADRLRKTRPTGHDLFFAVDWMTSAASRGEDLVEVAERYAQQSIEQCRKIGEYDAGLMRSRARILTQSNAGALAAVACATSTAPKRRG